MNATIEKISEVNPHPNADRLELCKILGFQCVTQKGLYKSGDIVVYIRPDTILPEDTKWADGYRQYAPKRIKAIKLRNEWSEGIIVPLSELYEYPISEYSLGDEISEIIGIRHYEPPILQEAQAKRSLPFGIPKTDEERWENLVNKLPIGEKVDITLKIDGQSWSIYYNLETDEFGVLGRTLEYNSDTENRYSYHILKTYPQLKDDFIQYCKNENKSLCLRGESYGNGIQNFKSNPHASLNPNIAIFSIYNITDKKYENKGDKYYFINVVEKLNLSIVDLLEKDVILTQELINKYSFENDKLENGNSFEGVVVKHSKGSFKIISKSYDSKK